jgi:hypothetical protein
MACERYRDALTDVAAGAQTPGAVEAHLQTCQACRAELEALRRALAVADKELGELAAAEPSPELAVRIRQAVADPEPSPAWRFGWLWPVTAAAATLLVALAVWVGRLPVIPSDSRPPGPGGTPIARAETAADAGRGAVAPRSPASTVRPEVRRAGGSLGTRQDGVPRDDAPEVLVPAGEAEAFLRFAAHLQTRIVAPDSLLVADLSAPLEPKGVEIQPLEIVPLDPAEASGTD